MFNRPSHSDLVKAGIAAARAAGVVWGRPRKQKKVFSKRVTKAMRENQESFFENISTISK